MLVFSEDELANLCEVLVGKKEKGTFFVYTIAHIKSRARLIIKMDLFVYDCPSQKIEYGLLVVWYS